MEKIKIFHSADPHGDLEAIRIYSDYIKEQKPDIAFLTGDLIHRVYTKEQLDTHNQKIQGYQEKKKGLIDIVAEKAEAIGPEKMNEIFPMGLFAAIRDDELEEGHHIISPEKTREQKTYSTIDLYDMVKDPKQIPKKIWEEIMPYLNARERFKEYLKEHITAAEQSMETQYKEIAKILEGTDCLVLPGNHDGKCLEKIMPERNMHKKDCRVIKGIKIAGYGGAKGTPWWIPEMLLEGFPLIQLSTKEGKVVYKGPEAAWFMLKQEPDIAVLHETPFTDEGLKFYVTNEKPYLVLAGHLHNLIGGSDELSKDSPIILPGKLGIIPPLEGGLIEAIIDGNLVLTKAPEDESASRRTFVEIEVEKEESEAGSAIIQKVDLQYKQIKGGKVEALTD